MLSFLSFYFFIQHPHSFIFSHLTSASRTSDLILHYHNLSTHVPFRHSFYLICAFTCRLKEDLDHLSLQLEAKGKGNWSNKEFPKVPAHAPGLMDPAPFPAGFHFSQTYLAAAGRYIGGSVLVWLLFITSFFCFPFCLPHAFHFPPLR